MGAVVREGPQIEPLSVPIEPELSSVQTLFPACCHTMSQPVSSSELD
jgi:hypothetical protein